MKTTILSIFVIKKNPEPVNDYKYLYNLWLEINKKDAGHIIFLVIKATLTETED
ncbi:MAG: hypothetical protein ACNYWU_09070 [Desulfobacterales bacterium]